MNLKTLYKYGASLIAIMSVQACGGGSSNPSSLDTTAAAPPPPPPTASATTDRTVVGPISGFGSIILNGVRYDTNSASFTIDGVPGSQADLNVGQIITLKAETGSDGNAIASSVDFEEILEGPISSIDTANDSFVVLEQTVIIDNLTSFDSDISPGSIDGLVVGDIVEISGEFNAEGDILASRIDRSDDQSDNNDFEIHGVVSNLDVTAQTFNLGDLSVGFASASLEDFGSDGIADGDFVEVEGTSFLNDGTFIATSVENENDDRDEREGDEDDEAEISGPITSFISAELFDVAGITVVTNGSTEFEDGTATNLGLNVNVEVEGTFNAAGELVAEEVEFEIESEIEISSTIQAIDTANNTLTVAGVVFTVDESTRFEDDDNEDSQSFSFANLAVGDFVEITAFENGDDGLIASSIEREDRDDDDDNDNDNDDDDEDEIEAPVSEVGTDTLILLGVTIETDASTEFEIDDDETNAETFFSTVMVGDLVEAEGRFTSETTFLAEELELERDDDDDDDEDEIEAPVSEVGTDTLVLLGITIETDTSTEYEIDDDDTNAETFFSTVRVGDIVEAEGRFTSDTTFLAEELELERDDDDDDDDNDEDEIEAPVSEVGTDTLVLLGITIETDASTEYEIDDDDTNAETFFSTVRVGDIVEAEGRFTSDTTFLAEELELERDDD